MAEYNISNTGTRKLFSSRILEALTRTNFAVPVTLYYALSVACILYAAFYTSLELWRLVYFFPLGVFVFTLVEYLIHRFLFHFNATSEKQQKIKYNIHGVHHEYPKDKDRLAMPPVLSIVLAAFFFVVFLPVFGSNIWLFFPGFLSGYSTYLFIHYAVHRYRQPRNFLSVLWKHHSLHHYRSEETAFGVTFPLWDYVFGTVPTAKERADSHKKNQLPDNQTFA
jgi:4-hydroxysphinganine ceramide fatty acyl 2-hydroxylase